MTTYKYFADSNVDSMNRLASDILKGINAKPNITNHLKFNDNYDLKLYYLSLNHLTGLDSRLISVIKDKHTESKPQEYKNTYYFTIEFSLQYIEPNRHTVLANNYELSFYRFFNISDIRYFIYILNTRNQEHITIDLESHTTFDENLQIYQAYIEDYSTKNNPKFKPDKSIEYDDDDDDNDDEIRMEDDDFNYDLG